MLTDDQAKRLIAANVQRLMDEKGMNQTQLAEATGESCARVSMMVRGVKTPSAPFLHRIAEALEVTVDEILSKQGRKFAESR